MKIFISWSGAQSQAIGEVFRSWLPDVLQFTEPYFSPSDIDKGARWNAEISRELEQSRVGLICLTATNLTAPWLMFEAGAISKAFDGSRLCPLLFGVDVSQVVGPLVHFQATPYSREEIFKFVTMINSEAGEDALTDAKLERAFTQWWPDLERRIGAILESPADQAVQKVRSQADIAEETLALVRALAARDGDHEVASDTGHWALLWDAAIKYGRGTLDVSKNVDQSAQYDQLKLAYEFIRLISNLAASKMVNSVNLTKRANLTRKLVKDLEKRITELHLYLGAELDGDELPF